MKIQGFNKIDEITPAPEHSVIFPESYRSSFENHKNHCPCLLVLLLLVVVVTSASGEAIIGSNDIHGLQGKSNISTTPKVTKCVTQNEIRLVGAVGESFILIKLNAVSLRRVPYIPTTYIIGTYYTTE